MPFVMGFETCGSARWNKWCRESLPEGTFVEADVGQGAIVFVTTRSSPETGRGRWFEGILLGAEDPDWQAWYDNHGGEAEGDEGDATGMFHLCKKANCASALGRDVNLAQVHLERMRVLSQAQALALPYGAVGVQLYLGALDGQTIDSSADERTALNQFKGRQLE
jgi:hypothetical protein